MKEPIRYICGNGEGMFDDKKGDYICYKEHQEIVNKLLAKINYTQCCEELKAVNDGKNGEGMDLVRSFNKEFRSL